MQRCLSYLFLSFICCFGVLEGKPTYGNLFVESVVRVHDGDTFTVDIADVHPIIGKAISIRINHIDTPEITDKRARVKALALDARDYVKVRLLQASCIELTNIQRDKYFRVLADVYVDGKNLAQELIQKGFAQPYDGGAKPNW